MPKLSNLTRFSTFAGVVLLSALSLIALFVWSTWFILPFLVFAVLSLLGLHDVRQNSHSVLRNYPVLGHLRFLLESIRPEVRQYLLEDDHDEEPFSRDARSLVYQRAKGQEDARPFCTKKRVYEGGYSWVTHSVQPKHIEDTNFRITVGNKDCKKPYSSSIYNISAMSFGSLSANAISALNKGAAEGGFAHDTGEGGISRYHREGGGDLIYEIGSGYFGCRNDDGSFSPEKFTEQAASDQI